MATSRGALLAPLVAAAVVVGTGVGLVMLTDGGSEPPAPAAVTTRSSQVPASITIPRTTVTLPQGAGIVGQWEEPLPLPPMGIETVAFDWQVTELEGAPAETAWIGDVLAFDGELWVVTGHSNWGGGGETTTAWTSLDGIEWIEKALPEALAASGPPEFALTDEALVAVGERWTDGLPQLQVLVTTDGETWTEGDLSAVDATATRLISPMVAASPDGIVITAGSVETFAGAEPPIVTIEYDGYTVILDEADWSFQLLDPSGTLIVEGGQELIWDSPELAGSGIFDPVSGERVFTIDENDMWEVPIEAYEQAVFGEPLRIRLTSGDDTATVDEYTGVVTITDEVGAVVFSGSEQVLWAGPPPAFTDPASGEVVLRIPWEEWDAAYEAAFADGDGWAATPVVLWSSDGGLTWSPATVPELEVNVYLTGVAYGPPGFLVIGSGERVIDGEFRSVPIVLASADGVTWSVVDSNLSDGWVGGLVTIGDNYMARVGQQETLATSRDGISWVAEVTEADLELPLGTPHFGWATEGDLGVFVIGRRDGYEASEPTPMVARSQGRTLTIEGSIFTVVEDVSGETLFTFDESHYWAGEEPGAAVTGFKWGTGGLAIFDDDGMTLFTLSHRQFDELVGQPWNEVEMYEEEPFLLYDDGSEWRSVALPDVLNLDLFDIAVSSDKVIVGAMTANFDYSMSLWVLVGAPR